MNFEPQPYPLFVAFQERGELETGRIIGWSVPAGDDLAGLQPVAILKLSDLGVNEPRRLDLKRGVYFIAGSPMEARDLAQDAGKW
jgi:hypothetical protein